MRKQIKITEDRKKQLTIMAAEAGMCLQHYIEKVVSDHANSVKVQGVTLGSSTGDGSVTKDRPIVTGTPDVPLNFDKVKKALIRKKDVDKKLDTRGKFVKVEGESDVYTNGKCFQAKRMVIGTGLVREYFASSDQARDYLAGLGGE